MSATAGSYYELPPVRALAPWWRSASVLAVLGLHVLLVIVLGYAATRPEIEQPVRALAVRLLEPEKPSPPKIEPPKPVPPQSAPKKAFTPPPVMVAAAKTEAPASFAVAPQPPPQAIPVTAAPTPAPVTAARFDADYLQNPKPVYPPMARRLGEEGKVVLRVRVSAQGLPLAVEIRTSSGFARLDEAAKAAVEQWRFVPAKQGGETVESSVLVPLNFTLSN